MSRAEKNKIKKVILANHYKWLKDMWANDVPKKDCDIAESANWADFKEVMFNGIEHAWACENLCLIDGVNCEVSADVGGVSISVYFEEEEKNEKWLQDLEGKYNTTIGWAEFDKRIK